MLFTNDDVREGAARRIRETAGAAPPIPVLTAMLALVRDQKLDHIIASCEESDDGGTRWHVVAVSGQALLTVDASSPKPYWILDNPGAPTALADEDKLDARLSRLSDVESVQAVRAINFEPIGEWTFNGQWRLIMRNGTEVDVRASEQTNPAREACDQLAHDLIDLIRGGGESEPEALTGAIGS